MSCVSLGSEEKSDKTVFYVEEPMNQYETCAVDSTAVITQRSSYRQNSDCFLIKKIHRNLIIPRSGSASNNIHITNCCLSTEAAAVAHYNRY